MIAPPTERELVRIPPGDRVARLAHYARLYRDGLARPGISARHRERLERAVRGLKVTARTLGCHVALLDEEETMAEAPNAAVIATRAFEAVAGRMHAERGIPEEDIALALLSAALSRLSAVWPPERVVAQLAGITGALIETHGIDPQTGAAGLKPTRN